MPPPAQLALPAVRSTAAGSSAARSTAEWALRAPAPHAADAAGDWLARLRIGLTYVCRHGRLPRIAAAPRRFTDHVQRRKLLDRDRRLPRLADKLAVKAWVAAQLGATWVTPTLWSGPALPGTAAWPLPFVVKSRHGCNQYAFVRTGDEDWGDIMRQAAGWMAQPYGRLLDEWLYSGIARGIIVEPFIGSDTDLPVDYKFYVFAGKSPRSRCTLPANMTIAGCCSIPTGGASRRPAATPTRRRRHASRR